METTIKPTNVLANVIPLADIQYATRENMFHQGIEVRTLNILKPYYGSVLGNVSGYPRLPLLININGGAWKSSTPWLHITEQAYYASHGYVVASIDYTTLNFDSFPAQIEDVKCAIRFLRKNAAKFGIDPDRIALMGDSAGAQLAALAGTTCKTGLFCTGDDLDVSDEVNAVIGFYGIYDFVSLVGSGDAVLKPIYCEYLNETDPGRLMEKARLASPICHVSDKTPPFLLLQGTGDSMVDPNQSKAFYERLIKAGIEADLVWLEGADHAGREFHQVEVRDIVMKFLERHLK